MRRSFAVACLLLAACGGSPSAPSSQAPASPPVAAAADFSGLWTGSYRLTSCEGDRHCFVLRGTTRTFTLRLRQTGARVRGLVSVGDGVAEVSGDVLKDGTLVLSGSDPPATSRDGSMTARLELRMSEPGDLQGRVSYDTQPRPEDTDFLGPTRMVGDVVSVTRTDLGSFLNSVDGTWSGRVAVRTCAPMPGSPYCYPFTDQEVSSLELTLARSGAALTGTLRIGSARVPLSGSIAGSAVTLTGETLAPASGGPTLIRVSDWKGSIDEFGRMTGTFTYEMRHPSVAPTIGMSALMDLRQVLKQP